MTRCFVLLTCLWHRSKIYRELFLHKITFMLLVHACNQDEGIFHFGIGIYLYVPMHPRCYNLGVHR